MARRSAVAATHATSAGLSSRQHGPGEDPPEPIELTAIGSQLAGSPAPNRPVRCNTHFKTGSAQILSNREVVFQFYERLHTTVKDYRPSTGSPPRRFLAANPDPAVAQGEGA